MSNISLQGFKPKQFAHPPNKISNISKYDIVEAKLFRAPFILYEFEALAAGFPRSASRPSTAPNGFPRLDAGRCASRIRWKRRESGRLFGRRPDVFLTRHIFFGSAGSCRHHLCVQSGSPNDASLGISLLETLPSQEIEIDFTDFLKTRGREEDRKLPSKPKLCEIDTTINVPWLCGSRLVLNIPEIFRRSRSVSGW